MKPGRTGLKRIVYAAKYSWMGLLAAFRHEAAFRQELFALLILVPVALWQGRNAVEYALLIGSLLLVLVVELVNSAIEAVVDRFGAELHELSGRAKDMGSAAVLLSILLCALVWGVVLFA